MDIIRHLFIPHHKNNFKAKVIHLHSLATYLIFFMIIGFAVNQVNNRTNVLGYATDITVEKLLELTNKEREKAGLEPLTYNDQLAAAAQSKAKDMFTHDYWSHYGPDGATPWGFILASGYKYEYAGENLAKNFMFSDGVVQAWMDSPTHRENILRSEYKEIGFAIVNGMLNGEETTLVVQMFGSPFGGVVADANAAETAQNPAESAPEQEPVQVQEGNEPAPIVINKPEIQTSVLANNIKDFQPSILKLVYNTNMLFIVFLMVAFALDLFVAVKLNVVHLRIGGKHLIHILFLGFMVAGLLIVAQGKIL